MSVFHGIVPNLCENCGGKGCLSCAKTGHDLENLEYLVSTGQTELYPDD